MFGFRASQGGTGNQKTTQTPENQVFLNGCVLVALMMLMRWVIGLCLKAKSMSQFMRVRTLGHRLDRKSTRLNSSHVSISYAVFCLIKKRSNTRNKYSN